MRASEFAKFFSVCPYEADFAVLKGYWRHAITGNLLSRLAKSEGRGILRLEAGTIGGRIVDESSLGQSKNREKDQTKSERREREVKRRFELDYRKLRWK